jgi:hypothetical protein
MKNAILSFVYNVLPEEEKEELDAIRLTEEDGLSEAESAEPDSREQVRGGYTLEDLPDFPDKIKN